MDLINGIVLTGEAALRQLEASTAKRINQRAEDENTIMSSHSELAIWIDKYFEANQKSLRGTMSEWGPPLDKVFTILKAAGTLKRFEVIKLIDYAAQKTSSRRDLPGEILWGLCKDRPVCSEWNRPKSVTSGINDIAQEARLWALHLVHSINLAIDLGVVEELLRVAPLFRRVPFSSFLDILHPERPQYASAETAENIIIYCKQVLDCQCNSTLARVAKLLPKTNLVGSLLESYGVRTAPIPIVIVCLFQIDHDMEKENNLDHAGELYRLLSLIEFCLSSGGQGDKTVIWDYLTAPILKSENTKPTRDCFFVPARNSHPGDMPFSRWRLEHITQLNIENISSGSIIHAAKPLQKAKPNQMMSRTLDGVLKIAYHMYPEEQWEDVNNAWRMVKALKRVSHGDEYGIGIDVKVLPLQQLKSQSVDRGVPKAAYGSISQHQH